MKRSLLALTSLLLPACAAPLRTSGAMDDARAMPSLPASRKTAELDSPMSLPGDYAVYLLSGNYRPETTTVTQRVVRRQHGLLVLDMTIEEAGVSEQLRLRIDDGARRGDLLDVERWNGKTFAPYGVEAYEARMNELVPAADENEGELGKSGELVKVGTASVPCVRTDYRVRVGVQHGTMSMLGVTGFPGENLGGNIVTDDGTVIYRAELVELGNRPALALPAGAAVAATPNELYEEVDE